MKKKDLKYVSTNIGNLTGLPVRLYDGRELIYRHSLVKLPVDPLVPYLDEVFTLSDNVGYIVAPHEMYYGILRAYDHSIVLGPTREIPAKEQELHEIAFEINVNKSDLSDFIKGMKGITPMPLMRLLQILILTNHFLNGGEKLSLSDVSIHEVEQEALRTEFETAAAEHVIAIADGEEIKVHDTMDIENFMMDAIRKGDRAGLSRFFSEAPPVGAGIIAEDALRQAKNTVVVTATLASRAAMAGGMETEEALSLSDRYIRKCERMTSVEAVINLNYRLVMDYAERMERLLYGHLRSDLVIEVNNYVRHHLSEPITVTALARHLCRGRSRLSTDFKRETGEDLSAFILKQKIEESKRLLAYTDKSGVEIALYLGFSSQSHFSRTFKKYTSVTPNEYRQKQKSI